MKLRVDWLANAKRELTERWLAADERRLISDAANSIDQALSSDPESAGESRYGDLRVLLHKPLGVFFSVDAEQRRVAVNHVWKY
jgi:hypothetical protein